MFSPTGAWRQWSSVQLTQVKRLLEESKQEQMNNHFKFRLWYQGSLRNVPRLEKAVYNCCFCTNLERRRRVENNTQS